MQSGTASFSDISLRKNMVTTMNTKSKSMTALLNLVKAAVFAALIAVMTAYIKFNTGINDGYLHFGDSMIYLAACILPLPYRSSSTSVDSSFTSDRSDILNIVIFTPSATPDSSSVDIPIPSSLSSP